MSATLAIASAQLLACGKSPALTEAPPVPEASTDVADASSPPAVTTDAPTDAPTVRPPAPGEIPESVLVSGSVACGFRSDVVTDDFRVDAFRIGRTVVTEKDWSACVSAGACSAPELDNDKCKKLATEPPIADRALVCASPSQAKAYCEWVGGRLPFREEWFLAARGTNPTTYPWGNSPPTCAEHARAPYQLQPAELCCGKPGCDLVVRQHLAGASPEGVEDVMLVTGELVGPAASKGVLWCDSPVGCIVSGFGSYPGSIVGYDSPPNSTEDDDFVFRKPYTFRCAWGQVSK